MLSSCQNESIETQTNGISTVFLTDDQKKEKIHAFDDLLTSYFNGSTLERDDIEFTADEAVWNIEALMNAKYAHSDKPFLNSITKTEIILLERENDKFNITKVANAYQTIHSKVKNQFESISANEKHILLIDVNDKGGQGTSRILEITSLYGEGESESKLSSWCDGFQTEPFGSGISWWWGLNKGQCCIPNSSSDAAREIGKVINHRYQLPVGHTYFTDIEYVNIYAEDYVNPDPNADDNHHTLIYRRHNNGGTNHWDETNLCLGQADMNWYYCNTWTVINQNIPAGKDFSHINLRGDATTSQQTTVHLGEIYYGTSINCTSTAPCPPNDPVCPILFCNYIKNEVLKLFI
jgi:hypothetical protein